MGNYRASSFQLARSARLILALHTSRFLRCVRAAATGSVDRTKKVNLLIPSHIPGSFCEFGFRVPSPSPEGEALTALPFRAQPRGAPPEPTREHNKGTPLRTNVIAWGGSHG